MNQLTMRILAVLTLLYGAITVGGADTPSSSESQPRANVTITFATPINKVLGAILITESKTWELAQAKDVGIEIKHLNTKDGTTAKIVGDWMRYSFYPGNRQPQVQVWFRETESDRLPKALQNLTKQSPFSSIKDKQWESDLSKGLVYEGTLLSGGKRDRVGEFLVFAAICSRTRPRDDKAPPPGSASVEGMPLAGNFNYAKGKQAMLAIQNGSAPILVGGKLAKDFANKKGKLRVTGKLVLGDKNVLVIEADKIEEVTEKPESPGK